MHFFVVDVMSLRFQVIMGLYDLTTVKRRSMRNALVPGRRPRKFPAPKFIETTAEPVLRENKLNDSD